MEYSTETSERHHRTARLKTRRDWRQKRNRYTTRARQIREMATYVQKRVGYSIRPMAQNSWSSTVSFLGIKPITAPMATVMVKVHNTDRRQSTRSLSRDIIVARAIIRVSI